MTRHGTHHVASMTLALALMTGCGGGSTATAGDGGTPLADAGTELPTSFFPPRAPAFTSTDNAPGSVHVSISGESLAQEGFPYDATPGEGDPVFVDGWSVSFEKVLVVVREARLSGLAPDPAMRDRVGSIVARATGPWLIDLARPGPIVGASGPPESAWPLAVIPSSGLSTSTRYAVSWDTQPASVAMLNVNVPESDRALVEQMVARGWTKYVVGTASYAGRTPSATVDAFAQTYPTRVRFELGFADPVAYVNCHNPELGEDAEDPAHWGLQPSNAGAARLQLTVHLDHLFWTEVDVEGTPLHFDPIAARATMSGADYRVTMQDLTGSPASALVDALGMPVGDRGDQTSGYTPGIGHPPAYVTNAMTPNLALFIAYQARGQGHLNADGECPGTPLGDLGL